MGLMDLYDSLRVFLLNIFDKLCSLGNDFVINLMNFAPKSVDALFENGGLNHVMFRFLTLLF